MGNNNEELKETIKEAIGENIKIMDENDTFNFTCKQCGCCCMNRDDIILNPFDIYNGAKYLGIAPDEFMMKYTYCTLGRDSKIPMVLLKAGDNGFCPLLKLDIKDGGKFKCIIHEAKPGACCNHPIGIAFGTNKTTGEKSTTFIKVEQCDNSKGGEEHTIKDWVQPYIKNIDEINIAHIMQTRVTDYYNPRTFFQMVKFINILQEVGEDSNDTYKDIINEGTDKINKIFTSYCTTTVELAYVNYDINKPFIEQAEANLKELDELYTGLKKLAEELKDNIEKIANKKFEEVVKDMEEKE